MPPGGQQAERSADGADRISIVRLSGCDEAARTRLLHAYDREVYRPAFPDDGLREDVAVWLALLANDPGRPKPRIEVLLALDGETVLGGATVEFYRGAECGLLTYIAVAAQRRGHGVGRRLIQAARAALHDIAGRPVPLLAETETYDDASDDHERAEIIERQRRLARMGAWLVDFDYVMPPLRPGLSPRRLHLMLLDDPQPGRPIVLSSHMVRALVIELAESLDAVLEAHAATAAMLDRLKAEASLALAPLPATLFERRFVETPSLGGDELASFSFAFELSVPASPRLAIRLGQIEAMPQTANDPLGTLLRPIRSFLDDVTTAPIGHHGRPLVVPALPISRTTPATTVALIRPPQWRYEAEGETTELAVPPAEPIMLGVRESFCVFGSGRVFYILTLAQAPGTAGLDEYAMLQLEHLALDPARHAIDPAFLGFRIGGDGETPCSLLGLAGARLAWLAHDAPRPNALVDILQRHKLIDAATPTAALKATDFRGLCVAVESDALTRLAEDAQADLAAPPSPRAADQRADIIGPPPHSAPTLPNRPLFAFAGLVQGVADFPFQDQSELSDSTQPSCRSSGSYLYAHPRFILELSADWRSFRQCRPSIGTCPYLLLMWLVSVHDQTIVAEMEHELEAILYTASDDPLRAVPLGDLAGVVEQAGRIIPANGAATVKANLRRRLDLFRWLSIHRSGNLFRYPREKDTLAAIQRDMGVAERFARAQDMLDRVEALAEDVSELGRAFSDRRTNFLVLMLTVLGMIGAAANIVQTSPANWIWLFVLTIGLIAFAVALTFAADRAREVWRRR